MADEQITSSTANIPYINMINVGSDQAAPSAGRAIIYVKSGVPYVRLDTGSPAPIGGVVALAEGQLAVGDGSGVLSALSLGTEGDVVTADASGYATWAAPAAPGGSGDTQIATHTVGGGGEASYSFSSIPGTYRHIRLEWISPETAHSGWTDNFKFVLNDDTSAIYENMVDGTAGYDSSSLGTAASAGNLGCVPGASCGAGAIAWGRMTWVNYASASQWKLSYGFNVEDGSGDNTTFSLLDMSTSYRSNTAITKLTISTVDGTNIPAGAVFTLYGVS